MFRLWIAGEMLISLGILLLVLALANDSLGVLVRVDDVS